MLVGRLIDLAIAASVVIPSVPVSPFDAILVNFCSHPLLALVP